jgi:hypothetical protein
MTPFSEQRPRCSSPSIPFTFDVQHYLVAEYFMIAPPDLSPGAFFNLTQRQQANLIWDALFVQRSPVSEACRGVVTTLVRLGLQKCTLTIATWVRHEHAIACRFHRNKKAEPMSLVRMRTLWRE